MKNPQRTAVLTVLASLVVGAGAGVLASVITSTTLESYAAALLGDRGFTALEPRKPNLNPQDYAEAVAKVRETQSRSLAVIMKTVDDSSVPSKWVGPVEAVGVGVVVSANGWILTTYDEISAGQNPFVSNQVWVRGERYGIENIVSDELSPFVLIKLGHASNLTPVGFGSSADVRSGDSLFVLNGALGLLPTTLEVVKHSLLSGPQPAEDYVDAWKLVLNGDYTGPMISASGDLLGFMTADGLATPLQHGLAFIQETLRANTVMHAALGAYVIDLSDVYNLDPDLRQGLSAGALVVAPSGRLPVPARGPAGEAGVLNHDIITAVDDAAITADTSLAELLATYDPGQTVRLNVLRGGALIELSVVLADASSLIY